MARFELEAHVADEYYSEGPTKAVVEIDRRFYARLRQLREAVAKLEVFRIELISYLPEFYDEGCDVPSVVNDVDCLTVNVDHDSFYWSGYIKHTDVEVYTSEIYFRNADAAFADWSGMAS